jgi:alanyl-tRNA synthetase
MAKELDLTIDKVGFDRLLEAEQERAKASGSLGVGGAIADVYVRLAANLPSPRTSVAAKPVTGARPETTKHLAPPSSAATEFVGYGSDMSPEGLEGHGEVLAILKNEQRSEIAGPGDTIELVLNQTPFYAEAGGQVGDTGVMTGPGVEVQVLDVHKPAGNLFLHKAKIIKGSIAVHDGLSLKVDRERRNRIRANHSATHLLHRALKVVLGETVNQKGSIVHPDYLRFDFSSYQAMTPEQTERVEDLVNGWIRDNKSAETKLMSLADAKAAGAVALFGEKYGEQVRVVTVHPESTELCGGTHVFRSGDIGLFKIVEESAIAAGVRRVVALTGAAALTHLRRREQLLDRSADLYKTTADDLPHRIEATQRRVKELEKKLEAAQLRAASAQSEGESIQDVNGIKVLTQRIDGADANLLKQLADKYRDKLRSGVVGLGGATADGKALILVTATKDIVEKGFKSGDAIRVMAAELGGKGGGKAELAQAGGTDPSKLPQAFERLIAHVKGA